LIKTSDWISEGPPRGGLSVLRFRLLREAQWYLLSRGKNGTGARDPRAARRSQVGSESETGFEDRWQRFIE
jgi:hypothetical protein